MRAKERLQTLYCLLRKNKMIKSRGKSTILLLALFLVLFSCSSPKEEEKEWVPDFTTIKDTEYIEVKRRFSNGLSFDSSGFQLEPLWMLNFKSNDSVAAWSSEHLAWYNFPILHDHGAVFNLVHDFFRVKSLHKDSIVFQRLEVKSKEIQHGYLSDVNMTFYSRDYIFKVLKSSPITLQRPSSNDTLFIKSLAEGIDPKTNKKYVFAARDIAQFIPLSKNVRSSLRNKISKVEGLKPSNLYMYPRYRIEIDKAYKEFNYLFRARIDETGHLEVIEPYGVLKDAVESRKKLIQGISDLYIKNLFNVVPGSTLGFAHPSEMEILLQGRL